MAKTDESNETNDKATQATSAAAVILIPDNNGNVTSPLKRAVKNGDMTIASLTLRRANMGDLAKLSISRDRPYQPLVQLAALLSGLPVTVIEQIDPEDFKPISSYVSGFLL